MPDGVIKDNPLLRALQNSITDGAPTGTAIRRPETGDRRPATETSRRCSGY